MQITEAKLRQIVLEEVRMRILEEYAVEELFKLLLEQEEQLSDDEYLEQWRTNSKYRERVKQAIQDFDALPSPKKIAGIVAMGIVGAGGTEFAGDYAQRLQASQIVHDLRAQSAETKAELFGTLEDLKNFRDAAEDVGSTPIDVDDAEGIERAKDKFMGMGAEEAPIIADRVITMQTGEQTFHYTPADNISDTEILPFVGISKADWEKIVRTWLASEGGLERLEKYVGTSGATQALFWAYGPQGNLFDGAFDDRADGERGLWLPPEWSVAYDVIQKNKSRAGMQASPDSELGLSTTADLGVWKETLRKHLHSLLSVL